MAGAISQFAGIYSERALDVDLRERVHRVWVNDLTASQNMSKRVMPDGCANIIWTNNRSFSR